MMKLYLAVSAVLALAVVASVAYTNTVIAGPPDSATVFFGQDPGDRPPTRRPDCPDDPISPPGPPECFDPDHDESAEADDILVPKTIVISARGTVLYDNAGGVHRVAIYEAGTKPKDIDTSLGAGSDIDDPEGRLAFGDRAGDVTFQYNNPGRYLVICTFRGHFNRAMWGYADVK